MRKKILIAEQSDAIRGIAESLLHQNGYDVISASSAEKAKELIITAEPNMLIIGADIKDNSGTYLYDLLSANNKTSSLPLLLIADPSGRDLSYPDEVILQRPFDPKDFLYKVKLFVGGDIDQKTEEKPPEIDPFTSAAIDDEFLDAALGIDNISVESSEVVGQSTTKVSIRGNLDKKQTDDMGITHPESDSNEKSEDNKVESLIIKEDNSTTSQGIKVRKPDLSASSKIEISSDQYGLDKKDKPYTQEDKKSIHDYSWFMDEMKKGNASAKSQKDTQESKSTDHGEGIEKASLQSKNEKIIPKSGETGKIEIKPGGVDKFITEFKKEMEQLGATSGEISVNSGEPESGIKETETGLDFYENKKPSDTQKIYTEEFAETVSPSIEKETSLIKDGVDKPDQLADSSKEQEPVLSGIEADSNINHHELIEMLVEKIARELVSKIDNEEIYRIIKNSFAQSNSGK